MSDLDETVGNIGLSGIGPAWWRRMMAGESRKQIAVSVSALAGSGLIAIVIRFLGTLVQARYVGPEVLGRYAVFTIVPSYLFLLHLGVFTALARQYPYWIGQGDRGRALNYVANGLGWARALGTVQAVGFLIPSLWSALHADWIAAMGWGAQSIMSFTDRYMLYLGTTYRGSSEFVSWSKTSIVGAVTSLLMLPVVIINAFGGLCLRAAIPNVLSAWYAHRHRPLKIAARLDRSTLVDMIAFGAPLMLAGYVYTSLWDAVVNSFVVARLGDKSLGILTFAGSLVAALATLSTSISSVFVPRIAALYGSSNNNMAAGFRYCMRVGLVGTLVMAPIALGACFLMGPFVRHFLPGYLDCIPVARWLCWTTLLPVLDLPRHLLLVARHTRAYGLSVLGGFGLFVTLLTWVSATGHPVTLLAIVIALLVSKIVVTVLGVALAWRAASHAVPA